MISVVISYCSLDRRFLRASIAQALEFSADVIVVAYDRLMNGEAEDSSDLDEVARADARVRVLVLPYDASRNAKYHHNLARWVGTQYARYGWTLLLDADEIADGPAMRHFLLAHSPYEVDAVSFQCHWYFRRPEYQAVQTEECGMLVRTSAITPERIFSDGERWAFKEDPSLRCAQQARLERAPLMHHFSWVRTRAEMLKKVAGWAHKNDRDWQSAIEEEFSRPFNGVDFVHGYRYREVPNRFGLLIDPA